MGKKKENRTKTNYICTFEKRNKHKQQLRNKKKESRRKKTERNRQSATSSDQQWLKNSLINSEKIPVNPVNNKYLFILFLLASDIALKSSLAAAAPNAQLKGRVRKSLTSTDYTHTKISTSNSTHRINNTTQTDIAKNQYTNSFNPLKKSLTETTILSSQPFPKKAKKRNQHNRQVPSKTTLASSQHSSKQSPLGLISKEEEKILKKELSKFPRSQVNHELKKKLDKLSNEEILIHSDKIESHDINLGDQIILPIKKINMNMLETAAMNNNLEIVTYFISRGITFENHEIKKIIVHVSALYNRASLLNLILNDCESKTPNDWHLDYELKREKYNKKVFKSLSPIIPSIISGNKKALSILLPKIPNWKEETYNWEKANHDGVYAIHVASVFNPDLIEMLVEAGEDVNRPIELKHPSQIHENGDTPLHMLIKNIAYSDEGNEATRTNEYKRIKKFLNNLPGYHINAQNVNGDTPIHMAIMLENIDIFKLLIQYGANPNLKNRRGFSANDIHQIKTRNIKQIEKPVSDTSTNNTESRFYNFISHPLALVAITLNLSFILWKLNKSLNKIEINDHLNKMDNKLKALIKDRKTNKTIKIASFLETTTPGLAQLEDINNLTYTNINIKKLKSNLSKARGSIKRLRKEKTKTTSEIKSYYIKLRHLIEISIIINSDQYISMLIDQLMSYLKIKKNRQGSFTVELENHPNKENPSTSNFKLQFQNEKNLEKLSINESRAAIIEQFLKEFVNVFIFLKQAEIQSLLKTDDLAYNSTALIQDITQIIRTTETTLLFIEYLTFSSNEYQNKIKEEYLKHYGITCTQSNEHDPCYKLDQEKLEEKLKHKYQSFLKTLNNRKEFFLPGTILEDEINRELDIIFSSNTKKKQAAILAKAMTELYDHSDPENEKPTQEEIIFIQEKFLKNTKDYKKFSEEEIASLQKKSEKKEKIKIENDIKNHPIKEIDIFNKIITFEYKPNEDTLTINLTVFFEEIAKRGIHKINHPKKSASEILLYLQDLLTETKCVEQKKAPAFKKTLKSDLTTFISSIINNFKLLSDDIKLENLSKQKIKSNKLPQQKQDIQFELKIQRIKNLNLLDFFLSAVIYASLGEKNPNKAKLINLKNKISCKHKVRKLVNEIPLSEPTSTKKIYYGVNNSSEKGTEQEKCVTPFEKKGIQDPLEDSRDRLGNKNYTISPDGSTCFFTQLAKALNALKRKKNTSTRKEYAISSTQHKEINGEQLKKYCKNYWENNKEEVKTLHDKYEYLYSEEYYNNLTAPLDKEKNFSDIVTEPKIHGIILCRELIKNSLITEAFFIYIIDENYNIKIKLNSNESESISIDDNYILKHGVSENEIYLVKKDITYFLIKETITYTTSCQSTEKFIFFEPKEHTFLDDYENNWNSYCDKIKEMYTLESKEKKKNDIKNLFILINKLGDIKISELPSEYSMLYFIALFEEITVLCINHNQYKKEFKSLAFNCKFFRDVARHTLILSQSENTKRRYQKISRVIISLLNHFFKNKTTNLDNQLEYNSQLKHNLLRIDLVSLKNKVSELEKHFTALKKIATKSSQLTLSEYLVVWKKTLEVIHNFIKTKKARSKSKGSHKCNIYNLPKELIFNILIEYEFFKLICNHSDIKKQLNIFDALETKSDYCTIIEKLFPSCQNNTHDFLKNIHLTANRFCHRIRHTPDGDTQYTGTQYSSTLFTTTKLNPPEIEKITSHLTQFIE